MGAACSLFRCIGFSISAVFLVLFYAAVLPIFSSLRVKSKISLFSRLVRPMRSSFPEQDAVSVSRLPGAADLQRLRRNSPHFRYGPLCHHLGEEVHHLIEGNHIRLVVQIICTASGMISGSLFSGQRLPSITAA